MWFLLIHALDLYPVATTRPNEEEMSSGAVAIAWENQQKINSKFGDLLEQSCKKLREKQINMKDFCRFLEGLFPPGDWIPESSSIDIDEIFQAINRNKLWDHLNYSPLQAIVRKFMGNDQDMNAQFQTYKKDLASFKATTKLVHYIDAIDSDHRGDDLSSEEDQLERPPAKYDRRYYRKLSVKLEARFTTHTLEYLDDLWEEFADLYNLPPVVTLLDHIHENSISVVWFVPAHLAPKILRAVDFYRRHHITGVEFDRVCIYQESKEYSKVRIDIDY